MASQRIAKLRKKAWALLEAGEHELALATFDQMVDAGPDDVSLLVEKGVAYFRLKRFADALATFDRVVERAPTHITALTNKAKTLAELNRGREALDVYKSILKNEPNHVGTWFNCGLLMARLGKHDKAQGIFEETLRLNPHHPGARYQKGVALWKQGAPNEALEVFEEARQINPDFYELLRDQGRILRELGQLQDAVDSFSKALRVKPKSAETELELAETLLEQRQPEKADMIFETLMARDKNDADAWDGRGRALAALGAGPRAAVHRGTAAMIRGDHENALRHLDEAVTLDPAYGAAWSNRGVVFNRMERYEEALESYQKALELDPEAVIIMENIGTLLYRKLGRKDDAIPYFKLAIRYDPKRWFALPSDIQKAVDDA